MAVRLPAPRGRLPANVRTFILLVLPLVGLSLLARVPPQEPESRSFFPPLAREYTPTIAADLAAGRVTRLHDGRPDLSGPWVGGGSNDDIEREGGLKPGEMPLLSWAKALRDARKVQDEPYL